MFGTVLGGRTAWQRCQMMLPGRDMGKPIHTQENCGISRSLNVMQVNKFRVT